MARRWQTHAIGADGGSLCRTSRRGGAEVTDGAPSCRRCAFFVARTWLLIRKVVNDQPAWVLFGLYPDAAAADRAWETQILGHGITAMAWNGRWDLAVKMLADASFDPPVQP